MSLTFLNPLFLFGLAAGILPILIHRLAKRKATLKKFPAVRLLIQSQRVMMQPQRLKHLLLLVLRILTVMGLAFMMARPVLTHQGLLSLRDEREKIIILDNSLSMGYREGIGERYDLAKKAATKVIESLKGQVLIVPTASLRSRPLSENDIQWLRTEEALIELDRIPLSFGRGDPGVALGIAYRKLKDFKKPGEILMISDMVRGDWEGFSLNKLGIASSEVGITFLRIGHPGRDSNFAIKGVKLAEGEAVVGVPARLEVTVSNLSNQSGSTLAQLYLSGIKGDQKSMDLKAMEDGKVYFEIILDRPGWVDGEVRLSGDRLPLDDIFYFSLKVREKVKVLVVDGDPKRSLRASESYYIANALNPGRSEGSPFLSKIITDEELVNLDVKPYDAIFLLNVARPQASKLSSILGSGKLVFIFLGDRVVPEEYNSFSFLPWKLREVKETGPLRPERIAQIDDRREVLKSFSGSSGESLRSASFYRHFKIEGSTRNLLTLGNKDPLLVEDFLGGGKLFLFSSSADMDWNNLPLKVSYLPLIQGLLKEAVGLRKDYFNGGLLFGEPFKEKVHPAQVTGPERGPGIYQFLLPSGEVRIGINPPLEESDLSKVAQDEMKRRFGTTDIKMVDYRDEDLSRIHARKKELWPFILAFVLVVLTVEMGVANRI